MLSHTKPASATTCPFSVRGRPSSTPRLRAWRPNDLVPHTIGGEDMNALEERLDGAAPGRAEHNLSERRRSSDHRAARLAAHRSGQPSGARGDRGHLSPLREARAPSSTEMPGGPLFRPNHEETHLNHRRRHTRTSRVRPLHSSTNPWAPTEVDDRQGLGATGVTLRPCARVAALQHPEVSADHIRPDSQRDRRRIDDGNTLEQVEHALSLHRRVEQPQDRFPGRPPRWTAVKRSRQPRSPFTLCARVALLPAPRCRAGCLRLRITNRTQRRVHDETHRGREMKSTIALVPEYDQQVLPGWCPTTEIARHCDAGAQPESGTLAARPAAWPETRGSRVAAGQRTEPRDDHPLDTHRDGCCDDGLARVRRPSPATSLTSEERSITRTFARAVHSVSPPRDSTTRDAFRDQTPRMEARTCCVQLPLTTDDVAMRRRQMRRIRLCEDTREYPFRVASNDHHCVATNRTLSRAELHAPSRYVAATGLVPARPPTPPSTHFRHRFRKQPRLLPKRASGCA